MAKSLVDHANANGVGYNPYAVRVAECLAEKGIHDVAINGYSVTVINGTEAQNKTAQTVSKVVYEDMMLTMVREILIALNGGSVKSLSSVCLPAEYVNFAPHKDDHMFGLGTLKRCRSIKHVKKAYPTLLKMVKGAYSTLTDAIEQTGIKTDWVKFSMNSLGHLIDRCSL